MFALYHITIVLGVVVFIRPSLLLLKFFLAGEVLTGQPDDIFVGVYVNNGIEIFLIQRIAAFSVKHSLSSVSFWVGGEPNPNRRRTTANRKAVKTTKSARLVQDQSGAQGCRTARCYTVYYILNAGLRCRGSYAFFSR